VTHRNILVERAGGLAVITLNRADKMNPLDRGTVRELRDETAALERDADIAVVVITGAGRAFSAGGDLAGYVKLYRAPAEFRAFLQDFHDLLAALEASEKIYVAAVNGFCVAGGLELMLACDIVLAAEEAKIGDGHVNFGQLPGAGGSQRLPRAIGVLRAKRLMLSGELLPAPGSWPKLTWPSPIFASSTPGSWSARARSRRACSTRAAQDSKA
jgi:enoyl-CoA hydratase